ncbi:MAG: hypothetical protein CMA07_07055 [Euryarchaeota archaeon]|nr:hypothetical protein [Euryarchaeota archaeon]|tara:strand:- start:8459 stop:9175 length:717 start_codon:yes stop_codon:yes gene_type:complete
MANSTNRLGSIEGLKTLMGRSDGFQRPNLFRVQLPPIDGYDTKDLNLLCKAVLLPGRQIGTIEKQLGTYKYDIVNAQTVSEVTMTFHVPATHIVKNYFEDWQSIAWNKGEVGYFKDYARDLKIETLKTGATIPAFNKQIPFLKKISPTIRNRLPDIGPFKLSQGEVDLDLGTKDEKTYTCRLIEAFPTTMSDIQLGDDQENAIMELTVSFKYRDWESTAHDAKSLFSSILSGGLNIFS